MPYPTQNYVSNNTSISPPVGTISSSIRSSAPDCIIKCPNDRVGLVIGTRGACIKDLMQKSGAHIRITDESPTEEFRYVEIRGAKKEVDMARSLVTLVIERGPLGLAQVQPSTSMTTSPMLSLRSASSSPMITHILPCPVNKLNSVTENNGLVLQEIMKISNTHISICEENAEDFEYSSRRLVIRGSSEKTVAYAKDLLIQHIDDQRAMICNDWSLNNAFKNSLAMNSTTYTSNTPHLSNSSSTSTFSGTSSPMISLNALSRSTSMTSSATSTPLLSSPLSTSMNNSEFNTNMWASYQDNTTHGRGHSDSISSTTSGQSSQALGSIVVQNMGNGLVRVEMECLNDYLGVLVGNNGIALKEVSGCYMFRGFFLHVLPINIFSLIC